MFIDFDILIVLEAVVSTNEVSWQYKIGRASRVELTTTSIVLGVCIERTVVLSLSGYSKALIERSCGGKASLPEVRDEAGFPTGGVPSGISADEFVLWLEVWGVRENLAFIMSKFETTWKSKTKEFLDGSFS